MLTQVRLEVLPGDKRSSISRSRRRGFWFALVNQNGVWPWRQQDQILDSSRAAARGGRRSPSKFSTAARSARRRTVLDLQLVARNSICAREHYLACFLNKNGGSKKDRLAPVRGSGSRLPRCGARCPNYLQSEASQQREKTKAAEQILALGNTALEQGNPQSARRASSPPMV